MIITRWGDIVTIVGPIDKLGYVKAENVETHTVGVYFVSDLRAVGGKAEILQAAAKFGPKVKKAKRFNQRPV